MNPSRSPAARPSQYLSEILPWGCGGAHGNRHLTPALGSCEWRRWDSPCRPRSRSAPSSGTRLLLGRPFEGPPHSAHTVGAGGVVTRPAGAAVEGELDADGVLAIDLVGDDGPALNEEVGRKGDHYAVGGLRLNVPRARLRGILIHSSPFPLCVLAQHSTGGNVNGPHGPSPRWLSSEELQGNEAIPRRPGRERPTRYGSCVLRQRAQQRRRAQASVPPQGRLSDTQAVSGANTAECKAFTAVSAAVIHV
jgi:hypothetical protein